MAVITISRELGSDGDRIADLVCEKLGYSRVDKAVLMEIAEESGVDVEAVRQLEESFTQRARLVSDEMTSLYRKQRSAFEGRGVMDEKTYGEVLKETLEEYAARDNFVVVGRGGQMVLQAWPTALHIRLFADVKVRAQRITERERVSEAQALRLVEQSDERKRQYVRHMFNNADWRNLKYYHLAIDTGRIPAEIAAQMIVLAAKE